MDIQAEKLRLIEWLANLNDVKTINKLLQLKKSNQSDWWLEISKEEKEEIERGIQQADAAKLTPNDQVKERFKKWL